MSSGSAIIVAGRAVEPPPGLVLSSFADPAVHRFAGRDRSGRPVTEVVVHESVTRSAEGTVAVLKRRGLGVHLIVAPDGRVTQHGDLASDRLAHAGGHNGPSVGIEVVNPYYGDQLRKGSPWSRVIDAPWAHRGRYVVPTAEQAEAAAQLVAWLSSPAAGLSIPRTWVGLAGTRLAMGTVAGADARRPGIYAHHYYAESRVMRSSAAPGPASARGSAANAPHNQRAVREAISSSRGRKRPRRKAGGVMASMASSFSVGSTSR